MYKQEYRLNRTQERGQKSMKKVVRLTPTEYELENGDIFPIPFEIEENITVAE